MVNGFGRFCRKLRIDRGELLLDMAQKLNVSSAFLSKVENGKKKPPIQWKKAIIDQYNLTGNMLEEFEDCFFDARNVDSIDISDYSDADKSLMLSFARKLDTVDKEAIRNIINNRREDT